MGASFNLYTGVGILAVDSSGDLYIADTYNQVVRRVDASTGVVTTVAGSSARGYSGDGGPATDAMLNYPGGVAVYIFGNIFIGEPGNLGDVVRRVNGKTGIITTVAGILGSFGYSGDGGPATNAELGGVVQGLGVDSAGNLYISDTENNAIRAVNMQASVITVAGVKIQPGDIATIAGNGKVGYSGDGGPATSATLSSPNGVAMDSAGNLFIADYGNGVVRRVDAMAGTITTVAGNGTAGYSGDGGPAIHAELYDPEAVTVDAHGNLFIADSNNERIRRVDGSTGAITTLAGGAGVADGGPAAGAELWLHWPGGILYSSGVALDASGNLFIADTENDRVRRVDASSGIITTVAGNGTLGYTGDGGPATAAQLNYPSGVAVDSAGNLFIADHDAQRVRRVDASTGVITTVAGNGTIGYGGDGGPATSAALSAWDVAVDSSENLFIADGDADRVRRVDASTGVITTVAGNGTIGYSGDGGPGTNAELFLPNGVAVDGADNLFIADTDNSVVRRVDGRTGIITTVAGGGSGGEGGPATGALLFRPSSVAVSAAGNLFIADYALSKVFRVDHVSGTISTVAGNGTGGYSGDGASATGAELDYPGRVALNGGDVYIGDIWNNRVRQIQLPAFVILSTGSLSFGSQQLNTPSSALTVTLTNSGDVALAIASIAASGDFSETDNCGAGVAVSASCTIAIVFTPTEAGVRSGEAIVTDSAGDSPKVISLTGTGTGPEAMLSPSSVSFPATVLGITSAPSAVTVTNNGTASLTFTSIAATGDFAVAASGTTCSTSTPVAASGSCVINVTFTPTASGSRSGSLTLTDNASGSPQTVSLSGIGTGPAVSLSAPLTFSAQLVGTTSSFQTVTLTNTGNGSLTFSAIAATAPFAIATSGTTCSTSNPVAAAGTCTVAVTFTPMAAGAASGSLSFTDNAPNSPQTIVLSGTGQDFSIAPPSGSSTSATAAPGSSATYTLSVGSWEDYRARCPSPARGPLPRPLARFHPTPPPLAPM